MGNKIDYSEKFFSFKTDGLFQQLNPEQQRFVRETSFAHRLTFQEFRRVTEACRDLSLWGESELSEWWQEQIAQTPLQGKLLKKHLLENLEIHLQKLKRSPKTYPATGLSRPKKREKNKIVVEASPKKISGMCPVASDKTVCCNLRTIDAIENCIFGCSYCAIQTFYSDRIVFDADLADKLREIELEPDRFYHFGTGQSSDSLAWGNRNGVLDGLCRFAANHPNVLLEFKTKSDNISYLLENDLPKNIVCSWSLNTPTIIENEEHFTAGLRQRIEAARRVADRGVKVAFHFHPMVYYDGWDKDYGEIASTLIRNFDPAEVLFLSFGSVTLIKPVIRKIRTLGYQTKILQMELVSDPHGKMTYPDQIKASMFKTLYESFQPWHGQVFMYLCMEKASIWKKTFGYVYNSNEQFERAFSEQTMSKL